MKLTHHVLWRMLMLLTVTVISVESHAQDVIINKEYPIEGPDGPTLSPPNVEATNECATHVYIDSFVPHATITVFLNGATVIGGPMPSKYGFAAIALNPNHPQLKTGDRITATQSVNGVTSKPTNPPMVVGTMPSTLPAPTIDPKIFKCGRIVPVHNLTSGVTIEVRDDTSNSVIGTGSTPNSWGSDWDPVVTSPLVQGNQISARQMACTGVKSGPSTPATPVQAEPSPLIAPTLDRPIFGNDAVTLHGLFDGALVQAFENSATIGSGLATGDSNWLGVSPPVGTTTVSAEQDLCAHSPQTSQQPTINLPPPTLVGPICPHRRTVLVGNSTINATLVLLVNNAVHGYGGAAPGDVPVNLTPPAQFIQGDSVQVAEYIGNIVALSNKVTVGCTDVITYHNDPQRTGWNQHETILTTANVKPNSFGLVATVPLDDQVDAQPLVVADQTIEGHGVRTVVYVATESNTVYAVDSWSGQVLKSTNLGPPVPTPLTCTNNGPNVGITGTPTIDKKAQILYVIAYILVSGQPTYRLHALDLRTLLDKPGSPVTVAASQNLSNQTTFAFDATFQRQRPALLEASGNIYAGFGSFCDFKAGSSRGWILGWNGGSLSALNTSELTNKRADQTTSDCTYQNNQPCFLSSVWMSGYGLAADAQGNLFFTTGNSAPGTYDRTLNIAESVVRMSGALAVQDFFTPANENQLDKDDNDYGSGGVLVLPDMPGPVPRLAVAAGKDGRMFVLNRDSLGGFNLQDAPGNVPVKDCWCGPSFFMGADHTARVVSSGGNQLQTWTVDTTQSPALQYEASASIASSPQDGGFFTAISSNGKAKNTAIIWAVGRPTANDNHLTLYAFEAAGSNGSLVQLWSGNAGNWPNTGGNANVVPTVANGRVYVASNKQLRIFGLTGKAQRRELVAEQLGQPERSLMPTSGSLYWGTIQKIEGNRLLVELRTGLVLQVDVAQAVKEQRATPANVGQAVVIGGVMNSSGTLEANILLRAKGRSLWGEDREP
jgi:hypothetical protein